jgi:peptidoglycan hydrolase CwlO-like protein
VVRFENALRSLDRKLASKHEWIDELTTEISRAQGELGKPFQHQEALHAAYANRKAINDQLAAAAAPPPDPAPATTDPDVAASLGVLASTHAAPPAGQHPGSNPSTARPYSPPAPDHDSTITLD